MTSQDFLVQSIKRMKRYWRQSRLLSYSISALGNERVAQAFNIIIITTPLVVDVMKLFFAGNLENLDFRLN